jgi:hypothetical protein
MQADFEVRDGAGRRLAIVDAKARRGVSSSWAQGTYEILAEASRERAARMRLVVLCGKLDAEGSPSGRSVGSSKTRRPFVTPALSGCCIVSKLLASPPTRGELAVELAAIASVTWTHPATGEPVRFGALEGYPSHRVESRVGARIFCARQARAAAPKPSPLGVSTACARRGERRLSARARGLPGGDVRVPPGLR